MTDCRHQRVQTCTKLCIFEPGSGDDGSAALSITCLDCGAVAEWIGLAAGVSLVGPMVSVDSRELRVPVVFRQPDEATGVLGHLTGGRH